MGGEVVDNIESSRDGIVEEEVKIGLVQSTMVAKVKVVRTNSMSQHSVHRVHRHNFQESVLGHFLPIKNAQPPLPQCKMRT